MLLTASLGWGQHAWAGPQGQHPRAGTSHEGDRDQGHQHPLFCPRGHRRSAPLLSLLQHIFIRKLGKTAVLCCSQSEAGGLQDVRRLRVCHPVHPEPWGQQRWDPLGHCTRHRPLPTHISKQADVQREEELYRLGATKSLRKSHFISSRQFFSECKKFTWNICQ